MFTKAFWITTSELVLVTFASAFAASLKFTNGTPSWSGVASAAIAGGIAALYALVTQLKSVQAVKAANTSQTHTLLSK